MKKENANGFQSYKFGQKRDEEVSTVVKTEISIPDEEYFNATEVYRIPRTSRDVDFKKSNTSMSDEEEEKQNFRFDARVQVSEVSRKTHRTERVNNAMESLQDLDSSRKLITPGNLKNDDSLSHEIDSQSIR